MPPTVKVDGHRAQPAARAAGRLPWLAVLVAVLMAVLPYAVHAAQGAASVDDCQCAASPFVTNEFTITVDVLSTTHTLRKQVSAAVRPCASFSHVRAAAPPASNSDTRSPGRCPGLPTAATTPVDPMSTL